MICFQCILVSSERDKPDWMHIQCTSQCPFERALKQHKGSHKSIKALIIAGANFNIANVVSLNCVNFVSHTFGIQITGKVRK